MYKYNIDLIKNDSEFKYYFMGLVAADGYISSKSNRIEITLCEKDIGILIVIRDILAPGRPLIYKDNQKAYRLTIECSEIKEEIMKFFNTTDKTNNLVFPYRIPDAYLNHYIRGYIDGDGNISVKKGQRKFNDEVRYYYGLRLRIYGTRAFLQGLHINVKHICNLTFDAHPHKKGDENLYYLEYGFSAAEKILSYVYSSASYFLYRKKQVYEYIKNSDSSVLAENYGNPDGCYNTHGVGDNEDIVGTRGNTRV